MTTKPTPGHLVVLTFKHSPGGCLGLWSGKVWYVWRTSPAIHPANWYPTTASTIKTWTPIPTGVLHTVIPDGAGLHTPLIVEYPSKPYKTVDDRQRRMRRTPTPKMYTT